MAPFETLIPFLLIGAVIYFLIIRPQMQEKKDHESLLASLAKDDRVVTSGGFHGRIVSVSDATVVLDIGDKARVTIDKTHVASRQEPAAKS